MSFFAGLTKGKARRSSRRDEDMENDLYTPADLLGSSVISDKVRLVVRERYGRKCLLCGTPEGQVCHVVARSHSADYEGWWIRGTGLDPEFRKNDIDNLIFLCSNHHLTYDRHVWTLTPSMADLNYLISFEMRDYEERQRLLRSQGQWTNRRLPPSSLGFPKGYINLFACMAHALEALNTSFVPPSLILQVQNQPPMSVQSQIPDFERTLLHLRSLYNRLLPKPTRASTETIRPPQPFAPPVFPQVPNVHGGGAFSQPGFPGMPFGVPPTYLPTQSTNQGMPSWGVAPHRFGVTPGSPTVGDPRYPAGTHVQQPYQGHGGAGAGPSGSSHGYPGPAGSSSSRRY
ncbi:hypothetical protein A0H81_02096 [Grifola frondosa]|uniref:HNH nuclease domain-containing protein n=1 Tax=Grifola frondosa TaxID=5627 RepID=A0A1C7MMH0_GRIFR|nr:hypothetical protein A0H81_02096 [Grifola frondosa]